MLIDKMNKKRQAFWKSINKLYKEIIYYLLYYFPQYCCVYSIWRMKDKNED